MKERGGSESCGGYVSVMRRGIFRKPTGELAGGILARGLSGASSRV